MQSSNFTLAAQSPSVIRRLRASWSCPPSRAGEGTQTLRCPEVADLWGPIEVRMDTLPARLFHTEERSGIRLPRSSFFLPAGRWFRDRSPGITRLDLWTQYCCSCPGAGPDQTQPCSRRSPDLVVAGIAILMSCLEGRPVDVGIQLQCLADQCPPFSEPMVSRSWGCITAVRWRASILPSCRA
ncbi:hypothetical protein WJX73_004194 [Symbiochloris irregularis]|uniref:Uncharacterized protein n=1 Tax=Symbiochloris irregularis TaxID=706552 RepID=A0AAW1P077_9CHLO